MTQFQQLLCVLYTLLVAFGSASIAGVDQSEINSQGEFDVRVSNGNKSGILLQRSVENILLGLDKRQQCAPGYGTCPGGRACACAAGYNCCSGICKYPSQTCCKGYICDAGELCCSGPENPEGCYPVGAQCCSSGGYCPAGSYCVKSEDSARGRCRVIGQISEAPSRTTRAATATYYSTRWYTITFTIYYYSFYYSSTTYYYSPYTTTSSYVRSSYTSTSTALSTQAEDSFYASISLSSDVDDIESSYSRLASSSSSSMESVVSAASRSQSSRLATATATGGGSGSSGGGSGGGGFSASSGHGVTARDSLFLGMAAVFVGLVGSLMLVL